MYCKPTDDTKATPANYIVGIYSASGRLLHMIPGHKTLDEAKAAAVSAAKHLLYLALGELG